MSNYPPIHIRPVEPADVPALRACFTASGFELPEPADRELYWSFQRTRALYLVALVDGEVMGGAGVAPLDGADPHTCELRRLIVRSGARRRGIGEALLRHSLAAAKQFLYVRCCFETGTLGNARRFYARHGFRELPPQGRTLMRPLRASAREWLDGVPVRPTFDGVTACALLGAGPL
jgi:putative acetyltransferase